MYSPPWRRSLRRLSLLVAASVGLLLAGLATSPAHADATGGRNAVHFNLTCGGEEFVVVSPSEPARPSSSSAPRPSWSPPTRC